MNKALLITLIVLSSMCLMACAQQESKVSDVANSRTSLVTDAPVELGKVHWIRDLELAQKLATESGKPLFVQFQEVPG